MQAPNPNLTTVTVRELQDLQTSPKHEHVLINTAKGFQTPRCCMDQAPAGEMWADGPPCCHGSSPGASWGPDQDISKTLKYLHNTCSRPFVTDKRLLSRK